MPSKNTEQVLVEQLVKNSLQNYTIIEQLRVRIDTIIPRVDAAQRLIGEAGGYPFVQGCPIINRYVGQDGRIVVQFERYETIDNFVMFDPAFLYDEAALMKFETQCKQTDDEWCEVQKTHQLSQDMNMLRELAARYPQHVKLVK